MCDLDPAVVAAMFLKFRFDLRGVANKKKFVDVRVLTQRHNGASNEVRRAKVTAHRVEGDLHRFETLRTLAAECNLFALKREHLPPAVVTARGAGDVRGNGAPALGTFVQMCSMPAIRRFART